ncbi:MAG: aspartyl protease family protein [Pseudomonadota bacterium]|jgi:predicted aspartyl protease
MGRIVAKVEVSNFPHLESKISFSALVDTGATYLTLPKTWKDRLGEAAFCEEVLMETATGAEVKGELCSPYRVQLDNFRMLSTEILFVDMIPDENGDYEPLIGYIPLEQSCLAVDMLGHRLIKLKHFDLK